MRDRIRQIIEKQNYSVRKFEQEISVSDGIISKFLHGKIGLKVDTLQKITEKFPQINIDWLVNGRGEMLLMKQQEKQQKTPPPVADDTQLQRLQDLLEAKQETISVLQETNNNLLSEIQQLRNYINVTSTKYIQMVEQTLAAATDTRSKINEIQVGFNAYHQSLAPSKHKITSSHHTPKTK
ncbi:MAG: helix-turn-helix domain-containing protein [Bacteroidales bacterium]|nr:helix-turn-helix domain-containing protein [Bacteroidales bacterium]